MDTGLATFALRRAAAGALLVVLVASAGLVLARLAPGDHVASIGLDPEIVAAERRRLGLDRPVGEQYVTWLRRAVRLDFGESLRYGLPVSSLLRDRALNSAILGLAALLLATAIGIPLGVITGSRRTVAAATARGASLLLLSTPPLVTSLALLLVASRTRWLPVGGMPDPGAGIDAWAQHLVIPTLALALPLAAAFERLQSRSMAESLRARCVTAAIARGIPRRRVVWTHAWRLSLGPVLAIYGIAIGAAISGSFAVEYVTSWQGLGRLMYDALSDRDAYLVAGGAAAGALFLAIGVFVADTALAAVDPRIREGR